MKKWFSNLRVSQKLTLISVFFVMPDSVMLYLFITAINANIQFARLEKKGNEFQRPLEELLEMLPQHREIAETVPDAAARSAQLAAMERKIDGAFKRLEEVDARLGDELQFTDEGLAKRHREHYRPHTVHLEWEALKAEEKQLSPEALAERHQHLVADVRVMITHAGDTSNLILDPDLDSYYLMDATLLALPATQDRVAEITAAGRGVLQEKYVSPQDRQRLAIFATMLQEDDLDRIVGSVQTAIREDPNFYGVSESLQTRVPPALEEYAEATKRFIHLTRHLFELEQPDVTPEEYLAAGEAARRTSFALWRIADEEVDGLLDRRIGSYEHQRLRSLLVAAGALLAAIGFVTFITRSISGPLRQQANDLRHANEALEAEIAERKRSERELEKVHRDLMDASRRAGMAEVATGVLHNVGNVLNSVNVSAMLISDRLSRSRVAHLSNVSSLLREHAGSLGDYVTADPKGSKLPDFIHSLAERLTAERSDLLKEAEGLTKNIGHIKDIVSVQQSYAKLSGITEVLSAQDLVEDAIQMNASSLERHSLDLVRDFTPVPLVRVDKHKVLQILTNVIRNAKAAMNDNPPGRRHLTICLSHEGPGEPVKITLSDEGVGIAKENLSRIFAHGFTTKPEGHGFGLHSSALSAKEIGGALHATSPGLGEGATFTIELPVASETLALPVLAAA